MGRSREYALYDTLSGVSCYSKYYGSVSKRVYRVRAKSIKQAYFLAAKAQSEWVRTGRCSVEGVTVEDNRFID